MALLSHELRGAARSAEAARARHSGKRREAILLYCSALGGGAVLEDLGFELADDADGLEHGGGVALGELEVGGVHEVGGEGGVEGEPSQGLGVGSWELGVSGR